MCARYSHPPASARTEPGISSRDNQIFHYAGLDTRYDEAAAKLAWSRTVEFFKKTLG